MHPTPRLYTSECSAHYPRLWNLVESLSSNKVVRKYPIMLDLISFTKEFAVWTEIAVGELSRITDEPIPNRTNLWSKYGADPLIGEWLDYFADHIGNYINENPNVGKQLLNDLISWHHAILLRTAPSELPRYMSSIKCPECSEYSVMKHSKDYFCLNKDCCHSWVKQ